MDVLSALGVAGSILAVAEFRTQLLLTSKQSRGESLLKQREEYLSFVFEKLKSLILELSTGSRISELSKTMESLKDGRRYARPEQESRIDSMSQLLEDLKRDIQIDKNDSNTKPSVFTETEVELFKTRLASLAEAESNIIADKIVASLNYDSRPVRHGSVPQAHKDTFQRAFDSRLSHWLRSGSGIFWISGKPGSGKSTFMKFIASHWQTAAEPWAVTELVAALRALVSAKDIPLKMCFFIDGLYEFDSDHTELCKVLCDMARSPHIKMCLSSRPWAVFEDSFGADSSKRLDIHELTRNDIRGFVSDQLQTHSKWNADTSKKAAAQKENLVECIAAQADGVFLWAFFVTKSIREDLSNGSTIADLYKRVSDLPSDLEQLFKHMLEIVDQKDHLKMAGLLQVTAHAWEPLHIDLYWYVEKEFEEDHYAFRCPIEVTAPERISKQREQTIRNINNMTKGLLKLINQRMGFLHRTYLRSKLPAGYNGFTSIATVYLGFLKTTRHDHSLVTGIVRLGPGQNSGPFISQLNLALMYTSEALKSEDSASSPHYQTYALLDEYEKAVENMVRTGHVAIGEFHPQACDPRLPFREELLRHNLTSYIAQRCDSKPDFFSIFDEPPLFAALTPMSISNSESPAPVSSTLELILQRGDSPNAKPQTPNPSDAVSPWVTFARGVLSVFNMLSGPSMFPALRFNSSLNNGLFDLLLAHGANPNQHLLNRRGAHTVFSHFLDISLSSFLGSECFDGYLRTLDAFLRAGASLGVPDERDIDGESGEAFGNLARVRRDESVLGGFCDELATLLARLAADPERARFVSAVTGRIIFHCNGQEEELRQLSVAISEGFPENFGEPLLRVIERELDKSNSRKRHRGSWSEEVSRSAVKHFRGEHGDD
ncbi:hypothetical protein V8E51_012581 [Hyaloscypha variabilis]